MPKRRDMAFAAAATVVVCAAIAAGFLRLGSPHNQREVQADQRRISNLQSIATEMQWFSVRQKPARLPVTLAELEAFNREDAKLRHDPVTGALYEYHPASDSAYELCATFSTDSRAEQDGPDGASFWKHPKGRYCFHLDTRRPAPS